MAERDEFGAFLLGFIMGSLTGAVAALLLAPQSGEKTRGLLRDKAIELGDMVDTTVDDARLKATELATEARTRAEELSRVAKERAEDLQHRGQVVLEEQKAKVTETLQAHKKKTAPPAEG
jgi:gas vesicle protein